MKKYGPAGMFERISVTAAYGSLRKKDRLFARDFKKRLEVLYKEIENGTFSRQLQKDSESNMREFKRLLSKSRKSDLQKAHENLKDKLRRRSPGSGRR